MRLFIKFSYNMLYLIVPAKIYDNIIIILLNFKDYMIVICVHMHSHWSNPMWINIIKIHQSPIILNTLMIIIIILQNQSHILHENIIS